MRVFQLNTFCGIKSTGRITTDIARLLKQQEDECRIGFGAENVPLHDAHCAYRIGTPFERKIHGALRKFLDGEGYGSVLGTRRLIRELQCFRPDLVHLHNLHGCYVNLSMLFRYLRKSEIPVILTLHDCWPFTGHCAFFSYVACEKWKRSCDHCPQLRSYPASLWWDGSKRNFDHKKKLFLSLKNLRLVTPSYWLAALLPFSFLRDFPVHVIPNGVNREIFRPSAMKEVTALREKWMLAEKLVVLAVAAAWDLRKGLRFLLEAAELLGDAYQVVVVGLTPKEIALLPPKVLGIEATQSAEELAAWYSLASCLANPSMEDNMPLVNLEALACGTPVVTFQTGGCPEALEESCGRIVPQGDVPSFAESIRLVAPQKERMKPACLARAAHFDMAACYDQYLKLYKELCP